MSERRPLPARRACETFNVPFGGLSKDHVVSVGFYADGSIGEFFVTCGKSGEQVEAIARDFAIVASVAIQFGAELEAIQRALTRDSFNQPQSIGSAIVDRLMEIQRERMTA